MGIRLSDDRYEEIKEEVVKMYEQHDIHCTPISGFEIASRKGVKIVPYSAYSLATQELLEKKSEDGFSLETAGDEWFIYYNDKKSYGRVNNTLMHEVGHIWLDHSEESELAETEARFFAKFALCPPVLIHKYDLRNDQEIAKRFEISLDAARYAYEYYQKWLWYGGETYRDYEIRTCQLFGIAL